MGKIGWAKWNFEDLAGWLLSAVAFVSLSPFLDRIFFPEDHVQDECCSTVIMFIPVKKKEHKRCEIIFLDNVVLDFERVCLVNESVGGGRRWERKYRGRCSALTTLKLWRVEVNIRDHTTRLQRKRNCSKSHADAA